MMKRYLICFALTAGVAGMLLVASGCSEVNIYMPEGTSQDSETGGQTLVTFHASVENRNLSTRSMSPIAKNTRVQLFAFSGTVGSDTKGPVASGPYESSLPGLLSGVDGYKMYLSEGIYNFYGVSENMSQYSMTFTDGQSEPLFNGIDYLWWGAERQDVGSAQISVPIVFQHSATQIAFEVTAGEGITLDQLVMAHITTPEPGSRMELSTGVIAPATSYNPGSGDKMGINGRLAQYVMLPFRMTVPLHASFTVLINGESNSRTYSIDVPVPDGEMKAGNSYLFKVVIQSDSMSFSSVNVTDWVDVDETGKPLYPLQ